MKTNNETLQEFFKLSSEKPWGKLVAIRCQVKDISQWRDSEPIMTDRMRDVVNTENWQDLQSKDFAMGNSSNSPFFMFKVSKIYESVKEIGVKTPVHLHHVPRDGELSVHPSNNKIEVLSEFFPEMKITCLYHDYDYLSKYWEDRLTGWYHTHAWGEVTTAAQYLELFGLDQDETELEIGYEHVTKIINSKDHVWGKVKPRGNDWKYIDITQHPDDELLNNSLFLTVSDRFHRNKMSLESVRMGDILTPQADGSYEYCGKIFNV